MASADRVKIYEKIEKKRKRSLIAYVTSIREGMGGQMAPDAIPIIIKQLEAIPSECKEIDFLIISNGGDAITALRIMNLLRERFDKITVLLPYVAYSAATILSLGADEIIMHPYSNLGPTDPQISSTKIKPDGQRETTMFGSEDIRNYIDFAKEDIGIRRKDYRSILSNISKDVTSLTIGSSKRSQRLSYSLSVRLLKTHMKSKIKIKQIARILSQSYYHHSYAVGRTEAIKIGLNIIKPDKELEDLLWQVWKDFACEMKTDNVFNPLSEIMENPRFKSILETIPIISYPANIPPQLVEQRMIQLIQETGVTMQNNLQLECLMAAIESTKKIYQITNEVTVAYWRNLNMELNTNITILSKGWIEK